ncbi:MAG: hypothetical protein N3D82_04245 [Ignisphaera sp.]|nr:hypothetical protein [Ignisphaera sp.]MCX8168219.1 hypothetical protein [Ignisphaera sp.]MDW8084911.1 hypothetical protein [Ignisphaera sp.]
MRLRNKRDVERNIDSEVMYALYNLLNDVRFELVEAFYNIAKRRLRELYDLYSITMLKFDKLLQLLRRLMDKPVEYNLNKLTNSEVDKYIYALPLELSITMRSLIQSSKMLNEFSQTTTQHYLKSMLNTIDDCIEDIARYADKMFNA